MTDTIYDAARAHGHHHGSDGAHTGKQTDDVGVNARFLRMLEQYRAQGAVKVDGGAGDDDIDAEGWRVRVNGGAGNDTVNARGFDVRVDGGAGDDTITARGGMGGPRAYWGHFHPGGGHILLHSHCFHHHLHHAIPAAQLNGGEGNDTIDGEGLTRANGGEGDDVIRIGGGSAFGGSGNDILSNHGGSAHLSGGAGDDHIISTGSAININSSVNGGAGNDRIEASGTHMFIQGGTGEDSITIDGTHDVGVWGIDRYGHAFLNTELQSRVEGGIGDDNLEFVKGAKATIGYYAGDGHDTLKGANEASTLRFGPGLTFDQATFSSTETSLTIAFEAHDGSITIEDYLQSGVPTLQFADGRIVDASTTIAYAGGDPDAYQGDDGTSQTGNAAQGGDGEDGGAGDAHADDADSEEGHSDNGQDDQGHNDQGHNDHGHGENGHRNDGGEGRGSQD